MFSKGRKRNIFTVFKINGTKVAASRFYIRVNIDPFLKSYFESEK